MMIHALIDADGDILRIAEFTVPPPTLPTEKGLRWLPVREEEPLPGEGEVLNGPVTTVEADVVRRVWTIAPSPPPSVPASVTMLSARLVLSERGEMAAVNAVVEAMGEEASIAWEYATAIERASPLVTAIAVTMKWDEATVDELFRTAARS